MDRQRVGPERLLLRLLNVGVRAVGQGEDRGDPNDADRPREGGHERAALLGHQVVGRQGQGGHKAHGRAARGLRGSLVLSGGHEGIGVGDDAAVGQLDDAGGVLVG